MRAKCAILLPIQQQQQQQQQSPQQQKSREEIGFRDCVAPFLRFSVFFLVLFDRHQSMLKCLKLVCLLVVSFLISIYINIEVM